MQSFIHFAQKLKENIIAKKENVEIIFCGKKILLDSGKNCQKLFFVYLKTGSNRDVAYLLYETIMKKRPKRPHKFQTSYSIETLISSFWKFDKWHILLTNCISQCWMRKNRGSKKKYFSDTNVG